MPVTVWLQSALNGRQQRSAVKLSLVPVAVGVSMNACSDVRYSVPGIVFGIIGAVAAAVYQVRPWSNLPACVVVYNLCRRANLDAYYTT